MNDRERLELVNAAGLERGGTWADLGAGRGAFTLALAAVLGPAATVWAVDRDAAALRALERTRKAAGRQGDLAAIRTRIGSFLESLDLPALDGLLMANSLHYAEDHEGLLGRLGRLLKPEGALLLVEYDTSTANPWVPYPMPHAVFERVAPLCGFTRPRLMARVRSQYHGHVYSALSYRATGSGLETLPLGSGGRMNYWLAKSDPETYGWTELLRDGKTTWDGVRNYKARNYIRAMRPGDLVLFYHSGEQKAVVGAMEILSEPHPDKTAEGDIWSAVEAGPAWSLANPVTLADIRTEPTLAKIHLVRVARLSVMPLEKAEFDRIVEMGGGKITL